MSSTNAQLVRDGYEALRRGDLDRVATLLDPEVEWHAVEGLEFPPCRNREDVLDVIRDQARFVDLADVDVLGEGDSVVVSAPAPDRPPFDRLPEGRFYTVLAMRDGRIVRMQDYARRADALAAAGVSRPA